VRYPCLLVAVLFAAAGCHHSPTEPTPDLSGAFTLTKTDSSPCGTATASFPVFVQQSGSEISFLFTDTGSVTGTIAGGSVSFRWESGVDSVCKGSLAGSGSVNGRTITGTVSGPLSCCSPATIVFSLAPR
jgi:hypothetical protein